MRFIARAAGVLVLAILIVVLAVASHHLYLQFAGPTEMVSAQPGKTVSSVAVREVESTIVDASEKVIPAVVSVQTTARRTVQSPFGNDPLFRHFFGEEFFGGDREQVMTGIGSGVIVDPSGIILTNNHVIEEADEIFVTLEDGRDFDVEIVGTDKTADIAVLRIKEEGTYPYALMGNSDDLQVGRIVLAVGTPFSKQLSHSVSMGIVSALGRSNLGQMLRVGNLIQTDAAINQGNSGGPLVNLDGEIVGINAAILSGMTRTSAGVGFAIPVNVARHVLESITVHGKVIRGYLGVTIQDLDRDLAESLGLPSHHGALISEVLEGSPAAKAGLRPGDVIVQWDGREIRSSGGLTTTVGTTSVGVDVEVEFFRKGVKRRTTVQVAERPDNIAEKVLEGEDSPKTDEIERLGIQVMYVEGADAAELNLPESGAVVVTAVEPGSFAARYGIQPGTGILEVNGEKIAAVADLKKALTKNGRLVMLLRYKNSNRYISVTL